MPQNKKLKLAYLVSHPIQYQAPLLRRVAQEPDIDLTVLFGSDFSVRGYRDQGFGVEVKWDVPLLEGYHSEFLPSLHDSSTVSVASPLNYGILSRLRGKNPSDRFDALWVHGYATVNALHGILAAKLLGIPVLLRAEPWLKDRPRSQVTLAAKRLYFAMLRRLVSAALPIGALNTEYWRTYLGKDFPLFLMPYAVDNQYFQRLSSAAAPTQDEFRAELGLDPVRPVILFASKLQTRKRCIDLMEAYAQLSSDGAEPHPYLLIVGDGEERPALEARARELGWDSIRFLGFRNQSELPRFFDLASVFVLPSCYEPWGLIVNEVMNAACPVIVSDDVGSYPDLVEDGVTGFVFPAGDVQALSNALRRVFATPDTASTMGRNALERVSKWGFDEDIRGLRRALSSITGKTLS
ncbi:MAG: glycosyltransferase family 4 protein [Acidobacteriaceae bacterium]|nr:glycosyltransferase family 4 protein [Acidobacteriaceae bacterium]